MPIYEYKCENGHVFDVIQKFSDEPLDECQECGAPAARVLTAPAIHFKGSGFHNTDYGKGKKRGASDSGSGESTGESKSSDTSESSTGSSDSASKSSSTSGSKAGSTAD